MSSQHISLEDHSKLLSTFKSYYRQHFNLQAFRQHKLEHFQCLTTHCYPATKEMWIREAPFNLQRASLCARDCGKNVEQIESVQQQAQVKLIKEYGERCQKESSAKQRESCLQEVMREQVEWINKTMSSLIQ
ncbi:hypothetical protein FGO68_gene3203 [Halteria grandinella]|uniref:Uncharacterized protein n=1 Tax=Halteria grandinella TaxID=5974 RepID=A0A8J8T525_HALGN|nr:hypothetical protein FGO68_gene3203 [Halteria grandinella]